MKMKKILAVVLSLMMTSANAPLSAFAEENGTNEAPQSLTEQLTADEDDAVVGTVQLTEKTGAISSLPDNDTLFEQYVNKVFSVQSDVSEELEYTAYGYNGLNRNEKKAYDIIAAEVKKIADGQRDNSIISLTYEDITGKSVFTPAELGMTVFSRDNMSQANEALKSYLGVDFDKIIYALLCDMPYEFYWMSGSYSYDKVNTFGFKATSDSLYNIAPDFSVRFRTDENYARSDGSDFYPYIPDTSKTSAAARAAANAKSIVSKYSGYSDYQKLIKYRDEICSLVEYDHYAADYDISSYNIRPWQLINVFDGDSSTNVVCEGYSKAFKYLCDLTSFRNTTIDCITVTGTMTSSTTSGPHMWNHVLINGTPYLVDVTNCDIGSVGSDKLFLKGAKSSSAYMTVMNDGVDTISYTYDTGAVSADGKASMNMLELYGAGKLKVSTSDYDPYATPAAPSAPTSLSAAAGDGKVSLSWSYVSGASYSIYRSTSMYGTYSKIGTSSSTSYTDTSVSNGTTYYYKVKSTVSGVDSDSYSPIDYATPTMAKPSAPTDLTATAGDGQVTLSWNSVSGATRYYIYKSSSSSSMTSSDRLTYVTGTTYTDTSVTNGTTYYYRVAAYNSAGESSMSGYDYARPMPPKPSAPTGLDAAAGDGKVTLTWNLVSGATKYYIYKSSSSSSMTSSDRLTYVTGTTYTDTSVTNGTTYYYRVTAYNIAGESDMSFYDYAIPRSAKPAAPTNLTATAGDGRVTLTWNESTGATRYYIYKSSSSYNMTEDDYYTSTTGTSYTVTGLTNGQKYYFRVSAYNSSGESSMSGFDYATPKGVLAVPTGVKATPYDKGAMLSWNEVSGAERYYIYYSESGYESDAKSLGYVTGTAASIRTLENGNRYYYWITAYSSSTTESVKSSRVSAYALCPPTNLTATAGDGKITLSWDPISYSTDVAYYEILQLKDGEYVYINTDVKASDGTSITLSGLDNGTTYYYAVRTYVNGDRSERSSYAYATPKLAKPAAPTGISVTAGDGKAEVSWNPVSGAAGYFVYSSTSSSISYNDAFRYTTDTSYTIEGLDNGTTYYFGVSATNSSGESEMSSCVSAVPQKKLYAPTDLTAYSDDRQITLSWNAVNDVYVNDYNIFIYENGEYVFKTSTTDTSIVISGLENKKEYTFAVKTYYSGYGYSELSVPVTAMPRAEFTYPKNFTITPSDGEASFSWDPVSDADYYKLYMYVDSEWIVMCYPTDTSASMGLIPGRTHYFSISGYSYTLGESAMSPVVSVTPLIPIKFTQQPTDTALLRGVDHEIKAVFEGDYYFFDFEIYENGSWVSVMGKDGFGYTQTADPDKTITLTARIADNFSKVPCDFRMKVYRKDGTTVYSDIVRISYIDDADITVQIADSLTIGQCIDYVNGLTDRCGNMPVLSAGQMRIIERVLMGR